MMKRVLTFLLAAVMVFPLAACNKAPSDGADFDEDALKKQSQAYMESFREKDFDGFYGNVTDGFERQVSKEKLVTVWDSLTAQAGDFEGELEAQFIEQQGYGIIMLTERYKNQDMMATFTYNGEGRIDGLNFRFVEKKEDLPLESTDSYEEIAIEVGAAEQKMDGRLTLPKNVEKPPVVILVQGSGQSDMDESIGAAPNRPFADIAHGLAERGIATIRYNKRFYQYPPASADITVEEEVTDDVGAAIALAASDERLDGSRIYVLGHSLGGMLLPKIASEHPEVKGIVSMAGTLRGLEDLLLDQNKAALALEDTLTEEEKRQMLAQVEAEVKKVKELSPEDAKSTIFGQSAVYWNSLNAVDSKALLRELKLPILILQGENDFQVYAGVDYVLWQQELDGRDNATFRLYPGLSHLFMPAPDAKLDTNVYDAPANVDPQVIQDISDWVKAQ